MRPGAVLEVGCGQGAQRADLQSLPFGDDLPDLPGGLTVTAAGSVFIATTLA
jgi:hypothetical protein